MRPLILILIVAILAMACVVLVQRRQQLPNGSVNEAEPVKPAPLVVNSVSAGGESPKRYRPATLPDSVRRKADAVAARHRGMSKAQLEQSAEMQQLGAQFSRHLESPEFQAKLKQAIEAMKAVKGIEHGTLSFDLHDLTSPNARAWLEAALSDDPQLAQDYVMNLLDGAVFEFAFDPSSDSSSGGVTVKGENAPP
jgi:hypothetical protein